MSTFIQIEGEKRGSKLWVHNGKGYVKERETPSTLFLRCRQFKKDSCKGRAVIRTEVDLTVWKGEKNGYFHSEILFQTEIFLSLI